MQRSPTNNVPPLRTLSVMRIIWFAMIGSPLAFLAVTLFVVFPSHRQFTPQPNLPLMNWVMLVTIVPATFAFRQFVFRRFQIDGLLPAAVYIRGNLIFWAGCEGVAMFSIVTAMVNGSLTPTLPIIVITLALQALTFPVLSRLYNP